MKKSILLFLFAILISRYDFAYEQHDPILLDGIHATVDEPYVIEGYEITNPTGDCIKILDSEHVIIRNNYLHDCGTDKAFQNLTDHYREGYATLVGTSEHITFEGNRLEGNFRGFMAYSTEYLIARNNKITNTYQYSPLWCERCDHSEFSGNDLEDNGDTESFWVPGDRSIGIWVKRSEDVKIHDNTVVRSTSDGIAVTGQIYGPSFTVPDTFGKEPQDDYSGYSTDVWIYDNLLLDNMEQGVWLVNVRDIKVYNNTIRTGCFTYGASISTEFNVGNAEFYNNMFLTCNAGPPGGDYSFDIYIHDNTYYSWNGEFGDFMYFSNGELGVSQAAIRYGAAYEESHSNREERNVWVEIMGNLAEEMRAKREYADLHKTYEPKGWFACELADGSIDEECRRREEAKGKQGVPREMLLYSSLMPDFDVFVLEKKDTDEMDSGDAQDEQGSEGDVEKPKQEAKEQEPVEMASRENDQKKLRNDSIYEELLESWPVSLLCFFVLIAAIVSFRLIVRRRQNKPK
jgi:hypothetical protein